MESSEEEDDFPSFESITPQSKIDSLYQSNTEKGVRKICCELLDLKDAVENLCGDMQTKYLSFLRITEEVGEMEHELIELRKHISSQGILVQDLMSGVCCELEDWTKTDGIVDDAQKGRGGFDIQDPMRSETEDQSITFLEKIDVLLAEHKVEEAIDALEVEEKNSPVLKGLLDPSSADASSYKTAFLERKTILELQLVEITTQPFVGIFDVKKALCGLIKLDKGNLAHQLLLQFCGSHLERSIEAILRTSSMYPETYSATLSKLVFSMISSLVKESCSIFGDDPTYTNRIVQWAEWKIEYLVRLVKENAPASETIPALRAASICIQASLSLCSLLESQGLKLSKLLLVLLRPYIEEVLELNFRRARRVVLGLNDNDESFLLSPSFVSHLSTFATSSDNMLIESGLRFMSTVNDIVEQLTPSTVLHFGGNILSRISQLYGKFVDDLIKALPGPAEDENLAELKEVIVFRAETDSEKLALLGMAYTIADELLPETVIRSQGKNNENKESKTGPLESIVPFASTTTEYKDWKRQLQHSFDKLKDHFCMQYVLSFIYSREGNTRLDARIYLAGNMDNLSLGSDPMPSLPFQALFGKLQQLATVAGDVLLGKDKLQKILLARLTETVVMWLSAEQDFWNLFEDDSAPLHPRGLQQLMLDMHFTVEIARFAGYPSRNVHQIVSAIIAQAITAFSARGLDPQSALLEDEWFVETAKAAINKLLSIASGSDVSDLDEDHIILDDEITSDSEGSPSSLSSIESVESFFSAENGEFGSPVYSDTES